MSSAGEWSVEEVVAWAREQTIDGAAEIAEKFRSEEVDGDALLACACLGVLRP